MARLVSTSSAPRLIISTPMRAGEPVGSKRRAWAIHGIQPDGDMRGRRWPSSLASIISPSSFAEKPRNGAGGTGLVGAGLGGTASEPSLTGGAGEGTGGTAARRLSCSMPHRNTAPATVSTGTSRQAAISLPCPRRGIRRSVGTAAVERDAADQVGRAQQLIVGDRILRRLVRIARRRGLGAGRRLVVLLVLVAGLGRFRLGIGGLVRGLGVGRWRGLGIGDRTAPVL